VNGIVTGNRESWKAVPHIPRLRPLDLEAHPGAGKGRRAAIACGGSIYGTADGRGTSVGLLLMLGALPLAFGPLGPVWRLLRGEARKGFVVEEFGVGTNGCRDWLARRRQL
jgi:hypothetical protein